MRREVPLRDVAWEALPPLETVLTESVDAVKQREAVALDDLLTASGGRCVIFGAGTLGRKAIELLRGIDLEPVGLCDSNAKRWGDNVDGLTVLSPEVAAKKFGSDALFLVTIWNDFHWYRATEEKLKRLGCGSVSSYAPLFWRFGGRFMDLQLLNETPHKLYAEREAVLEAEQLWADEESVATYRANILWRALGDASKMPYPALRNTYFPADLMRIEADEAIVDCGAFDGDTIRLVIETAGEGFAKLYAVEADVRSLEKLDRYVSTLTPGMQQKIIKMDCAVGEERGTIYFSDDGCLTSKAGSEGRAVKCVPLDESFKDKRTTFVKMDIEGAEYGALLGARQLIARDKPVLAICVYHTQSDVWRIPLLVRSMDVEYSLFLRSYDGDGFQTVMYAVPQKRMLSVTERGVAERKTDERVAASGRRKSLVARVQGMFPAGQVVRYLCVGVFNTAFAYLSFVVALTLLNRELPQRYLYLTVVMASVLVTPLNITVAFLGYKFVVFRTHGNFLREWLRCFAVYGVGLLPGLVALSAMTRLLQAEFHRNSLWLHGALAAMEQHLGRSALRWVEQVATGKAMAGYLAGAVMMLFTTAYSFMGHKHVTFKDRH